MSKLAERMPSMADRAAKMEVAARVLANASEEDGRIYHENLVTAIQTELDSHDVNADLLVREGRKSIASQVASAWANSRVIRLNREQRVPVYQASLGFDQSYFKVGSQYVPAETMGVRDFEAMFEAQERRISNAVTDQSIWREFFERARPGLEQGQSLVQQFQAGTLELAAKSNTANELETGEEEGGAA